MSHRQKAESHMMQKPICGLNSLSFAADMTRKLNQHAHLSFA
jgi:hypothetical protein